MAEVKTVQSEKPDVQITLTWDEAVELGLWIGTYFSGGARVPGRLYEGIDDIVCLEEE